MFAHETAGAARTRLSLRPLFFKAEFANLGRSEPREREVMPRTISVIARSSCDEAIQLSFAMDCFAIARNDSLG
jgi:hypothetical protein